MADRNICLANAKKINPKAVLCDEWICASPEEEATLDKFCHCLPPYPPQNPCPYAANSPSPVYYKESGKTKVCYCCCSCFAWGTPIGVPTSVSEDGFKPIQDLEVKDIVLAAGDDLNWKSRTVEYSNGVSPSKENGKTAMTVYFKVGDLVSSLIVTPDHVFLLFDKSLRRAEFLDITKDKLITSNGKSVDILGKELGAWYGGLHHIGTTNTAAESVNGHLINSKGIVTGDWALQISTIADESDESLPRFGTKDYVAKMENLDGDIFHEKVKGFDIDAARPEDFRPYKIDNSNIPDSASHFISKKQSLNIFENAKQAPISSSIGKDITYYLFKVFNGFYPDIQFRLLWEEFLPNAHSWNQLDVQFVVINGGLVRTEGIGFNEIAIVIAHEIGHLVGGAPYTPGTQCSCEGQADYVATSAILSSVFFSNLFIDIVIPGLDGIQNFFNYIDLENRNGKAGNTCDYISIDCRMSAFEAGLNHAALPACAGGPTIDYLEIVSAIAKCINDTVEITVEFNQPIDTESAMTLSDYRFAPTAKVSKVEAGKTDTTIVLKANLKEDKEYTLSIRDIISETGEGFKGGFASTKLIWDIE